MPLYLNASDCLLVCSNSEGSPMIVKEALACNLPIVSVDVGDVKERIKNVSQSKIVSKNYKEIAGVISNIFNSNKRSNGRKNLKFLSEQEVAERIAKIYQTVDIK
jgi:glycosyltransferase involved in cell wall biosynthesis